MTSEQTAPQTPLQNLLPVGLYVLESDVLNPKPDRRANQNRLNSFRQWAVWPKGLPLICERDREFGTIRLYPQGGLSTQSLREDEIPADLVASMSRREEKISDYLIRIHKMNYALSILDKLNLDKERVDAIVKEIEEEWDSE